MKSNTEINKLVAKEIGWFKTDSFQMGLPAPNFCESLDACDKWIKPQCHSFTVICTPYDVIVRVWLEKSYGRGKDKKSTAKAWCLAYLKAKGVEV